MGKIKILFILICLNNLIACGTNKDQKSQINYPSIDYIIENTKTLEANEAKALVIAWEDLIKLDSFKKQDLNDFKFDVFKYEGYYSVSLDRKAASNIGGFDGGYFIQYIIDAQDFSIIRVSAE